jgi:hypothetical protein
VTDGVQTAQKSLTITVNLVLTDHDRIAAKRSAGHALLANADDNRRKPVRTHLVRDDRIIADRTDFVRGQV